MLPPGKEKVSALSADVFLPVHIFALVQSKLKNPLVLRELLVALCDSDKRMSETGYFLCSFEAALSHLEMLEIGKEGEQYE